MHITPIRTPDLGDTSYLVTHDGIGILVDPQRDIARFLPPDDIELRWVLETHLHNDYVSGGPAIARRTGAELILPAAAAPSYRHTPAFHGEALTHGDIEIVPIHTPGHTPEHTSYLLRVGGEEIGVFSGGSLLVGAAGRSDLLGPDRADTLARLQYGSIHRLATLSGPTGLFPTHGQGSFCATSGAATHTSTIGDEIRSNPALAHPDVDTFVTAHLSGLDPYPAYYRFMGPTNLRGTEAIERQAPRELGRGEITSDLVIDTRPRDRYLDDHLPGSIGIEMGDSFATWVGWLTDPTQSIVLVADDASAAAEAQVRLGRIGVETVRGFLPSTEAVGESFATTTPAEVASTASNGGQVLDVRAPSERESSHIVGSVHRYLPELVRDGVPDGLDPSEPVWVVCGSGLRSSIAAGFLAGRGFTPIVLAVGGSDEVVKQLAAWDAACEPPLEAARR